MGRNAFKGATAQIAFGILFASSSLLFIVPGCQNQPVDASGSKKREPAQKQTAASQPDEAASRAAFLAVYPVFMHPRCMNCHPKGDAPLQGEDSHIHAQNVQRGADGKGLFAMKCANCHQWQNVPGKEMPPGHPEWHLPPANMRMVFEGKTAAELARQLKDPNQNGGKTLEQIVHHVAEDSLVGTAWNPAEGRSKPPLTQEESGRRMHQWVQNGAAIPE